MIVKFFSRGSGGGDAPVNYLLGDDRNREGASVLRGNAEITKEVINSTDYARRYTSGALSFEELHESFTDEQKNKIMDEFEKTLFAGLEHDQYNILWVQHTDKNKRLELNFLIANQELRSGKRLQPFFHAADLKRVNAFQNVINMTYELSDPHDPKRKRFNSPHFSRSANLKNININKDKKRYEKQLQLVSHKSAKNEITTYIYELAAAARLKNRAAIEKELKRKELEIVKVTDRSIRVKSKKFAKNIRLDDPIFSKYFLEQNYTAVAMHDKQKQYDKDKHKILADAQEVLKIGIEKKTKYHNDRFDDAHAPEPYDLDIDALESAQALTNDPLIVEPNKPSLSDDSPHMGF